jgi:trehalose synthase
MREVEVGRLELSRFQLVLEPDRYERLLEAAELATTSMAGRTVWNVNSTAKGGGVAEMLEIIVAYGRAAGVDVRWLVIDGDPEFFALTKRLHNMTHGFPGDDRGLGSADRRLYEATLGRAVDELGARVRPGDVVIAHDPQTAGLVPAIKDLGAASVWRCHVGSDTTNDYVRDAWDFLQPYVAGADALVFSREEFVPSSLDKTRLHVITPSVDPFSAKNQPMDPGVVRSILTRIGVLTDGRVSLPPSFVRRDGTTGNVDLRADVIGDEEPLDPDAPVLLQVGRWDWLKDMKGVLLAFADHVDPDLGAHLVLAGPETASVVDDPEATGVFEECVRVRSRLPAAKRRRIRLLRLPFHDVEANAAAVNALQRHASLILQKSLAEGFGLTVAEAMWKERCVVASAVGGIVDQIVDGFNGLLLEDPTDLARCGATMTTVLTRPELVVELGERAKERVRDRFLGDRHLISYGRLLNQLVGA